LTELQKKFKEESITWVTDEVRYLHRGVSKLGCDCTGLLIGISKQMGYLKNYRLRQYPKDWNMHAGAGNFIVEELEKIADEIPNKNAQEGDILVFRFAKCLAHAGILINKKNGRFVHSHMHGKKCEYGFLYNSGFGKRWEKTYRLSSIKLERLV
jgi:cell wall-associated NlpC family hydrolase